MNVASIEALLARKRKGYYVTGNGNPVVYSRVYRANVNQACEADCHGKRVVVSKGIVKQGSTCVTDNACDTSNPFRPTPMEKAGSPNVKQANVKQSYVKQVCELQPTVKPLCYGSGVDTLISSSHVIPRDNVGQDSQDSLQTMSDPIARVISAQGVSMDDHMSKDEINQQPISPAKVISAPGREGECLVVVVDDAVTVASENVFKAGSDARSDCRQIYDVNYVGIEDKFANSILHVNQFQLVGATDTVNTEIYNAWRRQSDFDFGFVPIGEQLLPNTQVVNDTMGRSPFQIHDLVKSTGRPNFMQARFPLQSQLNVRAWEKYLHGYWDKQLLHLIQFGFPLDFNRSCPLIHEQGNHKSATEFPSDITAYIEEEKKYNALLGPFHSHPIAAGHCSPFMTRAKPNSDRRRVTVDLSWPIGASVNAGIDKTSYLGSTFSLTFPTVDDITKQLKNIGRGALMYKVDVSRAFRHVKIDPGDYDLLGLEWQGVYVDTCVPFGMRHGSQIFQRLSDAVRYMMRQKGFLMVDYIDDYVGMGVPSIAWASYSALTELMGELGLTISEKKLVAPSTQVTCLGVLIDTVKGTLSIPPEKLRDVTQAVRHWLGKDVASKRQLQSILGLLLYVHKCVKPARIFLNRMLELLRSCQGRQKIKLTPDFKRDLRWFAKFLPTYNGISLYDHRQVDVTLELDACLTGFGGCSGSFVYHLPIERGFRNWTIVHLEMVNILMAIRLFKFQWASRRVFIRCDNEAVVTVLRNGKTRDPFLAACARNIWLESARSDIDIQYGHIRGVDNKVADLLSR